LVFSKDESPRYGLDYVVGVSGMPREKQDARARSCEGIHARVIELCCIRDAKSTYDDGNQGRFACNPQVN
jgi:hypothetical protein